MALHHREYGHQGARDIGYHCINTAVRALALARHSIEHRSTPWASYWYNKPHRESIPIRAIKNKIKKQGASALTARTANSHVLVSMRLSHRESDTHVDRVPLTGNSFRGSGVSPQSSPCFIGDTLVLSGCNTSKVHARVRPGGGLGLPGHTRQDMAQALSMPASHPFHCSVYCSSGNTSR